MITTIWYSIRKPSSYKQLTQQKLWRLVLTLLTFFTLLATIHALILANGMNPFLAFIEKEFPAKMPPFTYNGAQLNVEATTPLTLFSKDGYRVIVDVSSPTPRESLKKVTEGVILGKTELYVIDRGMEESVTYKQMMLPPLTKDDVVNLTPFLKPLFVVGLIIWSLAMIAWSLVEVTIFSFVASLFASMRKVRLTYREAWLISGFAFVPASIIGLLNFYLQSSYLQLAFWVAVFTYIYHGVGSLKEGNDVE